MGGCDNDDDNNDPDGGNDGVRDCDNASDVDQMTIPPFHVVPPRGGRNNGLERFEFRFASQPSLVIR
jgi:hypothetical protein